MANKDTHLILDIETIGNNVLKCPIIEISFTTFKWSNFEKDPYTLDSLVESTTTLKLDVLDQLKNRDCSYTEEDLKFWQQQGKEAIKRISPSPEDITVDEAFARLINYLGENSNIFHWWTRGNAFDVTVIDRLLRTTSKEYLHLFNEYLKFWRVRDVRTWIDAKLQFPKINGFVPIENEAEWKRKFVAHDSAYDIAADVLRLQRIHRIENDLSD